MAKRRKKPRGRPQIRHRLRCRTANLGALRALAIMDFLANVLPLENHLARNGIPSAFNSARPWSSLGAVVTKLMSIPWIPSVCS